MKKKTNEQTKNKLFISDHFGLMPCSFIEKVFLFGCLLGMRHHTNVNSVYWIMRWRSTKRNSSSASVSMLLPLILAVRRICAQFTTRFIFHTCSFSQYATEKKKTKKKEILYSINSITMTPPTAPPTTTRWIYSIYLFILNGYSSDCQCRGKLWLKIEKAKRIRRKDNRKIGWMHSSECALRKCGFFQLQRLRSLICMMLETIKGEMWNSLPCSLYEKMYCGVFA